MQAIILAAGSSTRTYPLTLTKPKPLLKIANTTILEHNLNALNSLVEEIIIVVGYKKEMIENFIEKIKHNYNFKIKLKEQKEQKGTADAVLAVKNEIKDKFLLLMGDNIHSKEDIKEVIKKDYAVLVKEVDNPNDFGVIKEEKGVMSDIIEKPDKFISNLINCALYKLDKKIFQELSEIKESKRGEYEITDSLKALSKKEKIFCIKSSLWIPIGYPWDILNADRILREKNNKNNLIGKNSKIEGEVLSSTIGNNCIIDGTVKNSVIGDNTTIEKDSLIEDSVIGENIYFSGKSYSEENIKVIVKQKEVTVKKLGSIIADEVIADEVTIAPGIMIPPKKRIKGKVEKNSF